MASKPQPKSVKKSATPSSTIRRDEYQLLMEDALSRLTSASKAYVTICNSDTWYRQIRTLGEDIAHTHIEKMNDPQRRSIPVPGDDGYILESTHQAVARALHDRDLPPFSQSCNLVVDMLVALRDMDTATQALGLPLRSNAYYHQYVESAVVPKNCYVFMLYITYLRVQLPADSAQLKDLDDLLERYRLLAILAHFPAGITDCFVQFHGAHRFAEQGGRPFENRYHYDRPVVAGDTLFRLIQMYPGWDVTTESRLFSMREHNPALTNVDPSQELLKLNPPVTHVRMVPSKIQTASYASRIKTFAKIREKQKENIAQMTLELLAPEQKHVAVLSPACIDMERFTFNWQGLPLQMGNRVEFTMLKLLVDKYPKYVPHNEIIDHIWSGKCKDGTFRATASRLRHMLKKANFHDIKIDGANQGYLDIKVYGEEMLVKA